MSSASTAAKMFRLQLSKEGVQLVLPSGAVVPGLVRRDVVAQARRAGVPDFQSKSSTSIEIEEPTTGKPSTGQSIALRASPTSRFRIRESFSETGYSMRFACEPYEVAS